MSSQETSATPKLGASPRLASMWLFGYPAPMARPFTAAAEEIVGVGRRLASRNLVPGAGGNCSMRLDDGRVAITISGRFKGRLTVEDVTRVDLDGNAGDGVTPSAETLLHCSLYATKPETQVVLHVHSFSATVLSRHFPDLKEIILTGYEMQKAMPDVTTHESVVPIPIVDNSQDMVALRKIVEARLAERPEAPAYIVRGHGLYAWGRDLDEAERVVEALELLLACELEAVRLTGKLTTPTA